MKMAHPNVLLFGIFAFAFLIGSKAQQQFEFSKFEDIPQSLLDQLGSAQVENLKKELEQNGGGGGAQTKAPNGGGGDSPGLQNLGEFSSFSDIPQSVLDKLPSDKIQQIKQILQGNGGGGLQTFQIPGMQGGRQTAQPAQPGQSGQQTFQFSKFSDIPQSFLDQLTESQIENIKKELMPKVQQPQQQQPTQTKQTLQYSSFSEIPQSVLDQLTSEQIMQIKMMLEQQGKTIKLPAPETSYSYTLPGGNNKRVNNVLNVLFNYVAAGGYLTGVPPIDLLLIRYYINMGPEKFC